MAAQKNVIRLQNFAGVFLKRDGHYLLMKRSPHKKIAPGVWGSVGGRIESEEHNDPLDACLREVEEETGITKEHIFNMELRYVIISRSKNVLMQVYVYFGETDSVEFTDTDEGTLHWIKEEELLDREFSKHFKALFDFHVNSDKSDKIMIGVTEENEKGFNMHWSAVENFEG